MKLRYFFKVNKQGKPIPGSNIRKAHKPVQGRWKEIFNHCCVEPDAIPCDCDFRYFVQIDYAGNPVDHTLIKRIKRPESDVARFIEVTGISCCPPEEG